MDVLDGEDCSVDDLKSAAFERKHEEAGRENNVGVAGPLLVPKPQKEDGQLVTNAGDVYSVGNVESGGESPREENGGPAPHRWPTPPRPVSKSPTSASSGKSDSTSGESVSPRPKHNRSNPSLPDCTPIHGNRPEANRHVVPSNDEEECSGIANGSPGTSPETQEANNVAKIEITKLKKSNEGIMESQNNRKTARKRAERIEKF
jgi:hypothetical protein